MKIAVLGGGNVGTSLGDGWAAKGHTVVYGSRSPEKYSDGARKFDTFANAITQSEWSCWQCRGQRRKVC